MKRTLKHTARVAAALALTGAATAPALAADGSAEAKTPPASAFDGLRARSIGPAMTSGRICDFAMNPERPAEFFVASCSGGVWKTDNNGVTFTPVFDHEGSYSIGVVEIDPNNPNVVWVGTGENNSQRSVSFGDGVYKSLDGGRTWKRMGLADSEHIGMIAIDPRDSDVVYVAAQGPLWRSGGDRGLYRTTNGGKSWQRILHISDDTGVSEIHLDPRDPDTMYAVAYQRRRHVWTLINGGPESAIYKSTDGGQTWRKIHRGLPSVDLGRIGLAISPADPDVLYAIVEAAEGKSGFFRSTDRGETWERRSDYAVTSPQYYSEIYADPHNVDRVFVLDTVSKISDDGGRTFRPLGNRNRHVDDHALWIDPADTSHLYIGCDGGVYESFDLGANWDFKENLPVTQFYRVAVDNSEPFFYVYGGTQDNATQGGPSRTLKEEGITNEDWFVTVFGDGFETVVDPEDPNIVYSEWQYGGLIRHDRRSGEIVDIKPREKPGEEPYVWNWDSPLIISPHSHTRLYFAADRLFRSDDRGDSWEVVSPDLTRGLDRNTLEVMGRIQPPEAPSKHKSTSIFGNATALTESPLVEGLIYVGTDDGLVNVTEDGGRTWRRIEVFPTVPDMTYVSFLYASLHDPDTVYAAFENHKNGDFAPYLLKSEDRGRTWRSIVGDLPEKGMVWAIAQDHVKKDLLFVGTEFGAYYTLDGGKHWRRIQGLPTIAVRDLDIQRRDDALAMATFGRGFYILDDYSPLREEAEAFDKPAHIFPVRDALLYVPRSRLMANFQGSTYFQAKNPPFGAVIRYYVKESVKTRKQRRKERWKKGDTTYPTVEEFREEDLEQPPSLFLEIRDDVDQVVRRIPGSQAKGLHEAAWDLRYPWAVPTRAGRFAQGGVLAPPGVYSVSVARVVDGKTERLAGPVEFEVKPLNLATFTAKDRQEAVAFGRKVARLQRAVFGAQRILRESLERIALLRQAVLDTPGADPALLEKVEQARRTALDLDRRLNGDRTLARLSEPAPPSISQRVSTIMNGLASVTSAPTQTQRDGYAYAADAFDTLLRQLRTLVEKDLAELGEALDEADANWTPGRFPTWRK